MKCECLAGWVDNPRRAFGRAVFCDTTRGPVPTLVPFSLEGKIVWLRALAMRQKALGPEHSHVAASLETYARLLRKTGRSDEAARMEARAKAIRARHAEQNPAN